MSEKSVPNWLSACGQGAGAGYLGCVCVCGGGSVCSGGRGRGRPPAQHSTSAAVPTHSHPLIARQHPPRRTAPLPSLSQPSAAPALPTAAATPPPPPLHHHCCRTTAPPPPPLHRTNLVEELRVLGGPALVGDAVHVAQAVELGRVLCGASAEVAGRRVGGGPGRGSAAATAATFRIASHRIASHRIEPPTAPPTAHRPTPPDRRAHP